MSISITSPDFTQGGIIPVKFTCDGDDKSPRFTFSDIPDNAKSLAVICLDPDAPNGTFYHWLIYNIPPTLKGFIEGIPKNRQLQNGSLQGKNDYGQIGYNGPCCPKGSTHRYFFRLYALDVMLKISGGANDNELERAMKDRVIAQGELMAKFKR
ncbi:MAG: Phospholipid-binding protein [Ignavibacteria bacterium]|nr:Phospholipid-binding protein [Ignavibacteria bacterium]